MPHARLLFLGLILPLGVACQSAHASAGGQAPHVSSAGLLPPARTAIEVAVGEKGAPSLAQLLDQLSAATGVTFTAVDSIQRQLETVSCGARTSASVPASEVWVWVQSLLLNEGFTLGLLSAEAPQLVAVYTRHPTGGRFQVQAFTQVAAAQAHTLSEHPALLVRVCFEMPHTDVRQLGNSLRALVTDPTGQPSLIPVGSTDSVILSGTGGEVAGLLSLLREIDAAEAEARERRAKQAAEEGAPSDGTPR